MLSLGSNTRIFLANAPTDLRKSFGGLSALVEGSFGMDAMSSDLFIFLNRRATQVRVLFWDRDGYCVLMKRLEEGTFGRVKTADGVDTVEIDAGEPLVLIRDIYEIEALAKKEALTPEERHALRQERSIPLLSRFHEWVDHIQPRLGKSSKLAKAVGYAVHQRSFEDRCFTDGRFEIDNGEIERTLKEPCIGRRNFLHTGSVGGGKRLATAYTLVQSCRALDISVSQYLVDTIEKLVDGWPLRRLGELIPELLSDN